MCMYSEAVEPGTVWTWNAIGKSPGAWRLSPDANESRRGFLLNHVISEELPDAGGPISNSDPVTGQAAWYDVRVRIRPAEEGEPVGDLAACGSGAGGAGNRRVAAIGARLVRRTQGPAVMRLADTDEGMR